MEFSVPIKGNKKLKTVIDKIQNHGRLNGLWTIANVNAVERLAINDHGPVHSKIVANSALRMFRLIHRSGVKSSVETDHDLEKEDAEIVIVLAAAFHDLGHAIHRVHHEEFGIGLADSLVTDLLGDIYDGFNLGIMEGEVLHACYAHGTELETLTLEAGAVKVADALDMEQGRARIPFKEGELTIHSVSATAIEQVKVRPGRSKPVEIVIEMSNSAGIFQLDNLFKPKLEHSGIRKHIEVTVEVGEKDAEKKIIEDYQF
ncbi:HD domain-containing protein [Candidatus Bipolaricaulota bacterium]|nr:HD domain-containing protein [Candidatus Bipolaricaulota bacterium]